MRVSGSESAQIGICRVLCIFFMMSVHVSPGLKDQLQLMRPPTDAL